MKQQHRELFQPIRIAGCEIKNRYCMSPMVTFGLVDGEGLLTDEGVEYYVERARGGIGLLMTGACIVEDEFEKTEPKLLFCTKNTDGFRFMQQMNKLTERIHAYGSKIFLQLSSGFGRVAMIPMIAKNAVAPSVVENKWNPKVSHRALTTGEVEEYIEAFDRAAKLAKQCGFDGVEIHALHEGYLLDQFATEIFNQRTDRFGGSFENRYRFATDIARTIKNTCGADFPISLRYSPKHYMKGIRQGAVPGEEFVELGRDMPEGIAAAKLLEAAGYDALNVDLGCYDSHYWNHPPVYFRDGMFLEAAARIKDAVDIPVIVAGRMDDPDMGARALRDGKCDIISLGRPSLADPYLPEKVRSGHPERVRHCISCNYGCSAGKSGKIGCSVNAQCGKELSQKILPAMKKRKVLIVGGGPGGAECARVCAIRGHEVTLMEKGERIGGQLLPASKAGFKKHDLQLADWYANELNLLGVYVRFHTAATRESVEQEEADTVIVATGTLPLDPGIPGGKHRNVHLAMDVLNDISRAGQEVVIIGAGQVGVETGLWLLENRRYVTFVEITDQFMPSGQHTEIAMARDLIAYRKGVIRLSTEVPEILEDGVKIRDRQGESFLRADTVIIATGYAADDKLYRELSLELDSIYRIGDAVTPRNVYYAIHEAFELAMHV